MSVSGTAGLKSSRTRSTPRVWSLPVILDLGCGPGSLGDRLAARLPGAEIVGLDYDPVLLALARVLHADDPDRSWIELDMRRHDWVDYLEGRQFDAVVSTTALHWLGAPNLMRVYQDLTRVLAPGGVFVNGDICSYDQTQPTLRRMAAASIKANRAAAQTEGAHDWVGWWNSIAEEPSLTAAVAERHRQFSNLPPKQEMTMEFHLAALRQVGFREVGCIWRYLSDYLALGTALVSDSRTILWHPLPTRLRNISHRKQKYSCISAQREYLNAR